MANRQRRKRAILERDDWRCGIHLGGCGEPINSMSDATIDHIFPTTRNTTKRVDRETHRWLDQLHHLQPMHEWCNKGKGARTNLTIRCACHNTKIWEREEGAFLLGVDHFYRDNEDKRVMSQSIPLMSIVYIGEDETINEDFLTPVIATVREDGTVHSQVINDILSEAGVSRIEAYTFLEKLYSSCGIDRHAARCSTILDALKTRGNAGLREEQRINRNALKARQQRREEFITLDELRSITDAAWIIRRKGLDVQFWKEPPGPHSQVLKVGETDWGEEIKNIGGEPAKGVIVARRINGERKQEEATKHQLDGRKKARQGQYQKAVEYYDKAIALVEGNPNAYWERAQLYEAVGRNAEAERDYDSAIRAKPEFLEAYNSRGMLKAKSGLHENAIEDYKVALMLAPHQAEIFNNMGNAYSAMGRNMEALEAYDAAIFNRRNFAEAFNHRGLTKVALGRLAEALADYDEAIRIKGQFPEALRNRGVTKSRLGRHEAAIEDFDKAVRQRPNSSDAYYDRGRANASLNRHEEAIGDYDQSIQLQPDRSESYCNRGVSKVRLGKLNEAMEDFEEALRICPRNVKAVNNRGGVKYQLGQVGAAIADFEEAIRLDPENTDIHYNLGQIHLQLGDADKSRRNLLAALEAASMQGRPELVSKIEGVLRKVGR